ncbi:hypothetical protein GT037_003523 [Alternaria burnsii]|uniref:Uncharacterized protein n=1 Tax=Alternaria burnsii TaxID=1187904 RepID=A0A8H7EJL0_9PLEO|nr:uncharacterized protein GT037_003523 [Alternaria burnsii]KAF7678142.1 hypothetical protein GT037_003523 [Alternaria burnsii]
MNLVTASSHVTVLASGWEAGPEGVVVGALTSKNPHITDATMQGEDMSFRHS